MSEVDSQIEIAYIPLENIIIDPSKKLRHATDELQQSIVELGLLQPITLDTEFNLIFGYHRFDAYQCLGKTEIPCIILDVDDIQKEIIEIDENFVRFNVSDLKRADQLQKRKRLYESLNRNAKPETIRAINSHESRGHSVSESASPAFTKVTADRLGISQRSVQQDIQIADNISEPLKEKLYDTLTQDNKKELLALSRLEDTLQEKIVDSIYNGKARNVIHARSLIDQEISDAAAIKNGVGYIEVADAMQWLESKDQCDLIITDPPYSDEIENIEEFAATWLPLALSKLKPTGHAYIFIGTSPMEIAAYESACSMPDCYLQIEQILPWIFGFGRPIRKGQEYSETWQPVLYFRGEDTEPLDFIIPSERNGVFRHPVKDGNLPERYHGWQKPIDLGQMLVRHATKANDVVYDPFAGTGSFLLAAASLGRKAFGCDQAPEMVKIAVERGLRRMSQE